MMDLPTTYAGRVQAVLIIPRHGRRLLCVSTCDASEALRATMRELPAYRYSEQIGARRYHEVKAGGTVNQWSRDHAPQPRDARLHELDAATYEPMDEWEGIAA